MFFFRQRFLVLIWGYDVVADCPWGVQIDGIVLMA